MRSWMKTSHESGSKIFINFYVRGYWTAEVEWKKKRKIKNEWREKCNEFYSFFFLFACFWRATERNEYDEQKIDINLFTSEYARVAS